MKKDFSVFAGRRLLSGPAPQAGPAKPPRARLASAQPRAAPARPASARRAIPLLLAAPRHDRGRKRPPRGDRMSASTAARQPRPDIAHSRPPSTAAAGALAHSRPHCLPSPPEQKAEAPPLAAPAAPPASSSRTTASFPDSSRPQLRLAFLQVALALAPPPSTGRASPRLATDGHGAAVLGRHGSHISSLLQPRLAALSHSPPSRASRALARSPCRGRRWPPASWPSRAATTSQAPAWPLSQPS